MDLTWPKRIRNLGSMITYTCPFRRGTHSDSLKRKTFFIVYCNLFCGYLIKCQSVWKPVDQYIHCKWDKDTDNMVWWPPTLDVCNRKYCYYLESVSWVEQFCHFFELDVCKRGHLISKGLWCIVVDKLILQRKILVSIKSIAIGNERFNFFQIYRNFTWHCIRTMYLIAPFSCKCKITL